VPTGDVSNGLLRSVDRALVEPVCQVLQMEKDHLAVDVYCFGGWHHGMKTWVECANAAGLMAACLHWVDSVRFGNGSLVKQGLIRTALACGRAAGLAETNSMMLTAQKRLFGNLKAQEDLAPAVEAGLQYQDMTKAAQLPAVWPPTGVQLYNAMLCAILTEKWGTAAQLAQESAEVLTVTHQGTRIFNEAVRNVQFCAQMARR
jgi:hypothetical protein